MKKAFVICAVLALAGCSRRGGKDGNNDDQPIIIADTGTSGRPGGQRPERPVDSSPIRVKNAGFKPGSDGHEIGRAHV